MKEQIKIVGKQQFRDSDMLRITLDIPRVEWLLLQQELISKSFGNIVKVCDQEIQLIDTTSTIDIHV